MRKPKCTDTRPCQRTTCYACVRRLIDEMAAHMLPQQVDAFRYPAINALAHQIPAPAPKAPAKPRKAPRLLHAPEAQHIADELRAYGSRQDAAALIGRLTIPQLQQVADLTGRKLIGKVKADKVYNLVESLVGYRLDTNAILNAK